MLRVYICPGCHDVRPVARRKEVTCHHCDSEMMRLNLTYAEFSEWDLEERKVFVDQWLEKYRERKNNKLEGSASKLFAEL